jgi:hypothetical protein
MFAAAATDAAAMVNPFKGVSLKPVSGGVVTGAALLSEAVFDKPSVVFVVRRPG